MPRMRILSTQEQEDFDRPPVFGVRGAEANIQFAKILTGYRPNIAYTEQPNRVPADVWLFQGIQTLLPASGFS